MSKKLTVGIVVYNNFPFLAELIYEIRQQVKKNPGLLQVVNFMMVDDHSTDSALIAYYQHLPSYIMLKRFEKNAGGPSKGRNYIMDHAQSEKILFIDGDDTIVGDLQQVVKEITAHDADIYMSDVTKITTDGRRELSPFYFSKKIFNAEKPFSPEIDLYKVIVHQTGIWSIYDLNFLRTHQIKYQENIRYEDNYFLTQVLLAMPRIHVLKEKYYGWRMNYRSFTNTVDSLESRIIIYAKILGLLEQHRDNKMVPWLFYAIWNQTYVNLARVHPYIQERQNVRTYLRGLQAVTKQYKKLTTFCFSQLEDRYIDIYTKCVRRVMLPRFWLFPMRMATRIRSRKQKIVMSMLSLFCLLPLNKKKIFFTSHYGEYNDNSKYLYLQMKADEKYRDFRFVFAVKDPKLYSHHKDFINYKNRMLFFYHHYTAKFVFFNSWYNPNIRKRKGQIWTQLWHGLPIKKVHSDINVYQQTFSAQQQMDRQRSIKKWDYAYTLNQYNTAIFARLFPQTQCIERIYYKTEWLIENQDNKALIYHLRKKYQIEEQAVLFAPTYRPYKVYFDYSELLAYLEPDEKLYIHLHPLMRAEFINEAACADKAVVFLEAVDDIQEIILCTNKVITDYSSIAYDYAKLQKTVLYYRPDQTLYAHIHGLYEGSISEMLQ